MLGGALPIGKLRADLLRELLAGLPLPPEVRLGPALGEDACAIDVQAGVLVATTDPITFTGRGVGAHAVLINANDIAVTGVRPRWFLATVLLPQGTTESDVRDLFGEMREALSGIGASLVGGHTEVTAAVQRSIVVGVFLGMAEDGSIVKTGGLEAGDVVLQVGPAPVEGAAVLATEAADRLGALESGLLESAGRALVDPGISVVDAALLSARLGACAMHDPTEGGLATGLIELSEASGSGLVVDEEAILWFGPGRALCDALGADPWGTLASGTLLAGSRPDLAEDAARELRENGFAVATIARAEGADVRTRAGRPLVRFDTDEVARVLA